MLAAGYKVNVIPAEATACVDGRVLPGYEGEFVATLDELTGPDVTGSTCTGRSRSKHRWLARW